MRRVFYVLVFSVFTVSGIVAQSGSSASKTRATLKLEVAGIGSTDGQIVIALWNSYDGFRGKREPFRKKSLDIQYSSVFWEMEDLPLGDYMISVYHDRNDNGKLDFNILHIPKEPYGFSNDARGTMGPPGWNDAKFSVVPGVQEMKIQLSK